MRAERQVAAAEMYIYRLRHRGASIDDVAAEINVSSHTLRAWVNAYWK